MALNSSPQSEICYNSIQVHLLEKQRGKLWNMDLSSGVQTQISWCIQTQVMQKTRKKKTNDNQNQKIEKENQRECRGKGGIFPHSIYLSLNLLNAYGATHYFLGERCSKRCLSNPFDPTEDPSLGTVSIFSSLGPHPWLTPMNVPSDRSVRFFLPTHTGT